MFDRIPKELQGYPQWVVWKGVVRGNTEKLSKLPFVPGIDTACDPHLWMNWITFDRAVNEVAKGNYDGIGFVLTSNDPFCIIDLDTPSSEENATRHRRISNAFETYQEVSPSGKGLHIVCRNKVPRGRNSQALNLEVYSEKRYMTFTGQVCKDLAINDCNEQLSDLFELFDDKTSIDVLIEETTTRQAVWTDDQVLEKCRTAKNGKLFLDLWNGNLQGDQSSHDLSLMNCIVFMSRNREQSERLFLQSPIANRHDRAEKCRRQDYMHNPSWGLLNKAFDQIVAQDRLNKQQQEWFNKELEDFKKKQQPQQTGQMSNPAVTTAVSIASTSNRELVNFKPDLWSMSSVPRPPGLMGMICDHALAGANLPLPEAAVAAAIGIMSGMAGRSYNFQGQGLNHYVLLVAGSGTGKDRCQEVISEVFKVLGQMNQDAADFKGPEAFTTDAALRKWFKDTKFNSVISMMNEFSGFFKKITDERDKFGAQLRSMLLTLFTMSKKGAVWGASAYSDKSNTVKQIEQPSFSFVGDIQPKLFDETVDERTIVAGFVPRLLCLHGTGIPFGQRNVHKHVLDSELFRRLQTLFSCVLSLHSQTSLEVQIDPVILEAHLNLRDLILNKRRERMQDGIESARSIITSRFCAKVVKLAALCAVGCNPSAPKIDKLCYDWAYAVVCADQERIKNKLESGDIIVGNRQTMQMDLLKKYCREWLAGHRLKADKQLCQKCPALAPEGPLFYMIPAATLRRRIRSRKVFTVELDLNRAFESALRALQKDGILTIPDPELIEKCHVTHRGQLFQIQVDQL